jgi:cytochrome P450
MVEDIASLADPAVIEDPYPTYARLRAAGRMVWDRGIVQGAWLVPRYADVVAAAREPRLSADRMPAYRLFLRDNDKSRLLGDTFARFLINKDGPEHARLRGLVTKAFTPRVVNELRPRVASIVDSLLDRVDGEKRMEVMRDLAFPLPAIVIAELLGTPAEDRDVLKDWSDALATFFSSIRSLKRAEEAVSRILPYFDALVEARRREPKADLLSAMLRAEEDGKHLSRDELLANAALLLVAGHHTTMHLIGNGLLALLAHPGELERLRADRSLVPVAVDELLRFDPSIQGVGRIATCDFELFGTKVEQGQVVMLLLASANRDHEQFEDPERLDVGRASNKHLAFAYGAHFCLGAALARVEGEAVLSAVLERAPRLRRTEDPVVRAPDMNLRGLRALHVRWD